MFWNSHRRTHRIISKSILANQTAVRSVRRRKLLLEPLEDRRLLSASDLDPTFGGQAQLSQVYGELPLSFEANQGQTDKQVNFLSRGNGYTLFLTPGEAVLSLAAGEENNVVRMRIVGANPDAQPVGLEMQSGQTNYLVGSDPSQWRTEVANYGRVEYQDVCTPALISCTTATSVGWNTTSSSLQAPTRMQSDWPLTA